MRKLTLPGFCALLILCAAGARPCVAQQQKVFNWVPANDETVRLDPANFYAGRTYHPGSDAGSLHVDIKSRQPITIFLTPEAQWEQARQDYHMISRLPRVCLREHVVDTTYVCQLTPYQPMTLIIRDERRGLRPEMAEFGIAVRPDDRDHDQSPADRHAERAVSSAWAAALASGDSGRRFAAPNDVHIQYYAWNCVANCIQPEFQWMRQVKEKYDLTPLLKVYGGFVADHDGEQVNIKIKSPMPMVVAMLPSGAADQLYSKPDLLNAALQKNACQQRNVQSLQFQCTFNVADGPQSLVVAPAAGIEVPRKKKAEIEMQAVKCILNCDLIPPAQQPQ